MFNQQRPAQHPLETDEENQGGQPAVEIDDADLQRFFGVPDPEAEENGGEAAPAAEPVLAKQRTWHS